MAAYFLYRQAWRFDGAPHEESKLPKKERDALLRKGGILIRNTYDFDCQEQTHFWYVIKDTFLDTEELSTRVRNKIRHAEKSFDFALIGINLLKEKGYHIIMDTYADYPVVDRKMNQSVFDAVLTRFENSCFDFWGIFDKTNAQLIGFCAVRRWSNCCEYDICGVLSQYKRNASYPYYGLFHTMNRYYLQEQGVKYISDGSRSITEHSNIHDFLMQHFHFRKAYCQLEVHYRWWMKIAVKMLYPFRKIITLPRVKAILNMEAMQRGEK